MQQGPVQAGGATKIIREAFDAAIIGGKTPKAALDEAAKKAEMALMDY